MREWTRTYYLIALLTLEKIVQHVSGDPVFSVRLWRNQDDCGGRLQVSDGGRRHCRNPVLHRSLGSAN